MDAYRVLFGTKTPMFSIGLLIRVPANLPEIAETNLLADFFNKLLKLHPHAVIAGTIDLIQQGVDAVDQGKKLRGRSPPCVHVAGDLVEIDADPQQRHGNGGNMALHRQNGGQAVTQGTAAHEF
jgi:hypothetical protein